VHTSSTNGGYLFLLCSTDAQELLFVTPSMICCHFMHTFVQVACPFKGGITVRVTDYRTASGGWIRLGLRNVAGDGDITMVELAKVSAIVATNMRSGRITA
jgi:hypothetical protein